MKELRAFIELMAISDAAARKARLEEIVADDEDLRSRIQELLDASSSPSFAKDILASEPGTDKLGSATLRLDESWSVIGPYKLLQRIGEGGMGTVFMAEQLTPVHRRVAVKIIKAGMDTR
jgi:hypothetical protein